MRIVSFFAGAGGLDLGFEQAGFDVVWANEYDREIWSTYRANHPHTILDTRSIVDVSSADVPDCDGIIGGPPCQSWSAAGAKRGITDKRGQLFYEFIRILADKRPAFFLAENVSGMLLKTHSVALTNIKAMFQEVGYDLHFQLINVSDYGIPQDRKRVFFVGFRRDLGISYQFPLPTTVRPKSKSNLRDAIGDLKDTALPALNSTFTNGNNCHIANHEYLTGGFSSIYMSRNRVRSWDEVSFTIQAGGRHAPLHPQAPKMELVGKDKRTFVSGQENLYRRLSVRECARIQTFPDNFIFHYRNLSAGYKMIGNAVPVRMAYLLAESIRKAIESSKAIGNQKTSVSNTNNIRGEQVLSSMNELLMSMNYEEGN